MHLLEIIIKKDRIPKQNAVKKHGGSSRCTCKLNYTKQLETGTATTCSSKCLVCEAGCACRARLRGLRALASHLFLILPHKDTTFKFEKWCVSCEKRFFPDSGRRVSWGIFISIREHGINYVRGAEWHYVWDRELSSAGGAQFGVSKMGRLLLLSDQIYLWLQNSTAVGLNACHLRNKGENSIER